MVMFSSLIVVFQMNLKLSLWTYKATIFKVEFAVYLKGAIPGNRLC